MPSVQDILKQTKQQISELTPDQLVELQKKNPDLVLLDVREKEEQERGILPNAKLIPRGLLELKIEDAVPDRNREIVAYCAGGNRSALAALSLKQMGYSKVHSLIGGYSRWNQEGRPTVKQTFLDSQKLERYSRHILMPEVGEEGQVKLLDSKVFLVGAGGLGSPTAYYLAAAGVGTLGIVDNDVVDRSNLQRQILHNEARIGEPKVESAKQTLKGLNPDINVVTYRERLSRDNVMELIKDYDVIVNGCDNFPTRYLINDACVFLKKPLVDGSIFRFEGQVNVIMPFEGPCYRCLYPEPPPPEMAPSCQEAGVFGVLPGIIGCIQGIEVLKLLLGKGDPLVNRLLIMDTLKMKVREMKVRRDPACPVCGDNPTIKELIDYEWFCSMAGGDPLKH
ncbi:molybdopterin-synthase adenylyltransferase MoeB [Deltaproteobacteria bacterium PRO3]|nr:molybdopterin-synthase adenylyltransferase MoeB [Deltaproteobacteria bacterium PRO3]